MAVSDDRQRVMPTFEDRERGKALAYKEAVLVTDSIKDTHSVEVGSSFTHIVGDKRLSFVFSVN